MFFYFILAKLEQWRILGINKCELFQRTDWPSRSSTLVLKQACTAETWVWDGGGLLEFHAVVSIREICIDFHFYTTRLTCVDGQQGRAQWRLTGHFTSKNLFNHQTWKIPSPINTPNWKIDHHLTLEFVLSAVFLCVLSRTTMYDCSSLTCERSSESFRTVSCQLLRNK